MIDTLHLKDRLDWYLSYTSLIHSDRIIRAHHALHFDRAHISPMRQWTILPRIRLKCKNINMQNMYIRRQQTVGRGKLRCMKKKDSHHPSKNILRPLLNKDWKGPFVSSHQCCPFRRYILSYCFDISYNLFFLIHQALAPIARSHFSTFFNI